MKVSRRVANEESEDVPPATDSARVFLEFLAGPQTEILELHKE